MVRLFISLFLCILPVIAHAQIISIPQQELNQIAERIFENECSSIDKCLIEWNEGEDFLSLGLGHFIWYPKNKRGPFEESFINFLCFALKNSQKLPRWLNNIPACPWGSRDEFLAANKDPRISELKELLLATKSLQAAFLIRNLKTGLALMLKQLSGEDKRKIEKNFFLIASKPQGLYVLVDYVNFKGSGLSLTERYRDQGWGLFQVLFSMNVMDNPQDARKEFVRSAKIILVRRVKNSPPQRNEQQWLAGWLHRLNTYLR